MPIFKLDKSTSKCRVVFLSNMCESGGGPSALSHNQVMHSGPCLNDKITSSVLHLRFGEKVLTYDLKKAFNQISLNDFDSSKLIFLWFRNIKDKDFSLIAFRNLRLSFGLRPSPTILMLALYKILCLDIENDSEEMVKVKKLLYALLYMDNGAFTGTAEEVSAVYQYLPGIFEPYHFQLQQFMTNIPEVQKLADEFSGEETPQEVKLLGLHWDRKLDTLHATPVALDSQANTKRKILKSIAGQFDIFNFQGPLLNRARFFLHDLQCESSLGWDTVLDAKKLGEWTNICKQANNSYKVAIPRFVGNRDDSYELVAFVDASKACYAAVVYLKNLQNNVLSFVAGKNRIVNKQLEMKTIPALELQAVSLGVELLTDLREDLSGSKCVCPISISGCRLYSDSMIVLHWLQSYTQNFAKMQKQSVFVMNRLQYIVRKCENNVTSFDFVPTEINPADCLTRCLSPKKLFHSNYLTGPDFVCRPETAPVVLHFEIPNPICNYSGSYEC